jgi:folate-binding protein YgfZ
VAGADRVRWLDGMVTGDVKALDPRGGRSGCHALVLTREGRIVADVYVLALEDRLLLECEREALPGALAHLERYVVAEDAALRDASGAWARLALEGPAAPAALDAALGRALALEPGSVAAVELAGASALAAHFSLSGLGGRQLLVPPERRSEARRALLGAGRVLGLVPAGDAALEVLRVERGVPRFGRELTGEVLPAEARMERAVSETKGCYTGQEVVARMRSRGRVSHLLVGLRFESEEPPAPGTELRSGERAVGVVTSAVVSPRLGAIGLGFVRAASGEPGTELRAGALCARVAALPFA